MSLGTALLLLISFATVTQCGEPVFDPTTLMRQVLVPSDAPVGAVIYRIRASDPDFDYPLQFELVGQMGRLYISIETLPCTKYNSVCQANVVLLKRLDPGRYVDFRVSVRNKRGRSNRIACSITGTNATTPRDTIFPHQPGIILIPEDAKRNTDLEFVIARKNPMSSKPLELELWGSPLFGIRQRRVSTENTEGTIFLLGPLDFEMQSMYHLTLLAVDPFVEIGKDSRNIAVLEVVVVIQDVQDMPPVFTHAPPVTHLPRNIIPGDIVVRVKAEDGDKGAPRQIRYGLVSEGNPFTPFFNINETTGEVTLERPIDEIAAISHAGAPIILTVVAEEIRLTRKEPEAMSTTVQLALILPERENTAPYFGSEFFITYLDENSPQGTALIFTDAYITQVSDNDAGKNGVFSLSLIGNNGTFEISPSAAERHTQFIIKVRDNTLLDYEARKSVNFQILAMELGPSANLTTTVNVTVYLNDVNDNAPLFLQQSYEVELPENITAGARVIQISADDVDTGLYGMIQYTAILGYLNTSLHLDPISGIITVATNNHGFDREIIPNLHFLVEARDNNGIGIRVTVPLIIKLLDVNDNAPIFERNIYEFILSPNLSNFTSKTFVKAIDKDAEPPNNIIQYEIIQASVEGKFAIHEQTGEVYLLQPLKRIDQDFARNKRQFESDETSQVYILTVRAYDLGIPRLFSTAMIKVYPPESKFKTLLFIVPGVNPDPIKTEEILRSITGSKIAILEIRPYKGNEVGATDVSAGSNSQGKSVIVASVYTSGNSVIDVSQIKDHLTKNKTLLNNGVSVNRETMQTAYDSTGSNSNSSFHKAENRLLFWILILLATLVGLALLSLIFCCICEGCPLYMPPRKRVIRVNSTEDDVHLMAKARENKSMNQTMQSEWSGKREAWSAEQTDLRTKPTQWKFNKRNYQSKEYPNSTPGEYKTQEFIIPGNTKAGDNVQGNAKRDGPKIIYTKEMQLENAASNKHREYMEDLENGYDRIATLHTRHDDDSLLRHDIAKGSHASPARDQYYIKEGDTEILRLVTRGKISDERYVNLPSPRPSTLVSTNENHGKDLLLKRFIREQDAQAQNSRIDHDIQHEYIKNKNGVLDLERLSLKDYKIDGKHESIESSIKRQNELLHQILADRERLLRAAETASQLESHLETQSLPGHAVMATQTECHTGTQTDEPRKSRSDNESYSEDEYDTNNHLKPPSLAWLKKRKSKKKLKFKDARKNVREIKRKIRTPILEETEQSPLAEERSAKKENRKEHIKQLELNSNVNHNLRNGKIDTTEIKNSDLESQSGLKRDVLQEISDSLEDQTETSSDVLSNHVLPSITSIKQNHVTHRSPIHKYSEHSSSPKVSKTKTSKNVPIVETTNEEIDENAYEIVEKSESVDQKLVDSTVKEETKIKDGNVSDSSKPAQKNIPRYMQWYAKNNSEPSTQNKKIPEVSKKVTKVKPKSMNKDEKIQHYGKISNSKNVEKKTSTRASEKDYKVHPRIIKEEIVPAVPECQLPDVHPLLQHSQHRYEHLYENQDPLRYIQPTHIPQYLGMKPEIPSIANQNKQPIYVNHNKSDDIDLDSQSGNIAIKHNISISENEKESQEVHVQKIKIGGDDMISPKDDVLTKGVDADFSIIRKVPITEKKSVFTIAYDDVHTKQLRPDSSSTSH